MGDLSISNTGLGTLLHSGIDLPSSMTRDIFLTKQSIVGTRFVGGAENLVENLKTGDKVTLLHEKDNRFDKNAVVVLDGKGNKLGYLPRYQNAVIASLLDAGKVFYGLISELPERYKENDDTSAYRMHIDLYMREFVTPGEMNAVPKYGCDGSYAVIAIGLSETSDESGPQLSDIYAIKVINGEERGNFRRILSGAERDEMRKAVQAFDKFTGYLPLVGHGLEGKKIDVLSEAYGVLLGLPLSNRIIDTEKMGRIHLSDIKDTSLYSYAERLGITCDGESEAERECRTVWSFYRRLEKSELESAYDIFDAAKGTP